MAILFNNNLRYDINMIFNKCKNSITATRAGGVDKIKISMPSTRQGIKIIKATAMGKT